MVPATKEPQSIDVVARASPAVVGLLDALGDRRVKSWTFAKRGRPTMQLKLLQAKQEETQGAIEEEKEEKKKAMLEQASLCHPVYGQTHSRQ
ncbi:hypothetical protein KUCAC02_011887 [Chaenocephalus aceratus]|uniref:Uncharacterized protein n=1 Tax=Chaenocephalus aceratus TaxID=36190 RepID=A0ACB9X9K1_CHAAC|nr:hypothetical protein KUCAC02_011887 [Chaenocephalus aceratus]